MVLAMEAIEGAIEQRRLASKGPLRRAHAEALAASAKMRLMRHGGCAIEALVPGAAYSNEDVPDIDAFTCRTGNAKKTAHAACQMMKSAGVEGLRVVPAIHKHTQSVRLGKTAVLDVSWVSPEEHGLLEKVARDEGISGSMCVPTAYLKMSMHLELSRPAVYIERWRKVWPRLEAVYGAFPECVPRPLALKKEYILPDGYAEDDEEVLREACAMGFVVAGRHFVRELTGEDMMRSWPTDLVLPTWPDDDRDRDSVVSELCARLELTSTGVFGTSGLFGPPQRRLLKGREHVARVHVVDTEVCTAASSRKGIVFGTSDLALHLLYSEFLRGARSHDSQRARLAEVIDAVVAAQREPGGANDGIRRRFTPFNARLVSHDEGADALP